MNMLINVREFLFDIQDELGCFYFDIMFYFDFSVQESEMIQE